MITFLKKFQIKKNLRHLRKVLKHRIKKQKNILKHHIKQLKVDLQEINQKIPKIVILLIIIKVMRVQKAATIGKCYLIMVILLPRIFLKNKKLILIEIAIL